MINTNGDDPWGLPASYLSQFAMENVLFTDAKNDNWSIKNGDLP